MRQGFSSFGLSGVGSLSLHENRTVARKKADAKRDNLNFGSIVIRVVVTKQLVVNSLYYQDSKFSHLVVLLFIKTKRGNNAQHYYPYIFSFTGA